MVPWYCLAEFEGTTRSWFVLSTSDCTACYHTFGLFSDGATEATGVPSAFTISPSTSASSVAGVGTNPFVSTTVLPAGAVFRSCRHRDTTSGVWWVRRCWFGSFRFGSVRFGSFRFVSFRFVSFRFVSVRFVSVQFGSVRFVSFRFGSVRFGSVGFGVSARAAERVMEHRSGEANRPTMTIPQKRGHCCDKQAAARQYWMQMGRVSTHAPAGKK